MTRYRYRAHDTQGRHYEEIVEAESTYEVTQSVKAQGLVVSSVDVEREPWFAGMRQLRWKDLLLFSQQLASVTRSGYPLAPAIKAIAQDLHRPRLRATLEEMHVDLERGASLEEALQRQEARFPPIYVALVRAGEATGDLNRVLKLMGDHASRMTAASHRLTLAMMYPLILSISSLCVLAYLLLDTVPVFAEVFSEFGGQLPAPTRFLLFLSDSLRAYWPVLSAALPIMATALVVGYGALRQTREGRYLTDWIKLYAPSLGPCYYGAVQARFCRTLSLLMAARVPILDSLTLAGAASGCAVLERAAHKPPRMWPRAND